MMNLFESDDYRKEIAELKKDPIIISMAQDIMNDEYPPDLAAWNFISAASQEYSERGGTKASSIGGPARAIEALLMEEK